MLKNYGYDGAYRDENLSVSVLLENPLEYGFEANTLVFSVTFNAKDNGVDVPRLEDFTFHIMDEVNCLYNTQNIRYLKSDIVLTSKDDDPVRKPDGLIITNFNHDFLFQDLRIVFLYRPYGKTNIIELKH